MKKASLQKFEIGRSMIHKLLLYSSAFPNIGLLQGKTGLAIFFMHYYKMTNNILYEDVAGELIDEVIGNLNKNLPITFNSGLSGIGWGIDYMIHKEFIAGNSATVCQEIDQQIMKIDPRRISDYSFETGLGGIILYVLAHQMIVYSQDKKQPFDSCYLHDLYSTCINIRYNKEVPPETIRLLEAYLLFYSQKKLPNEKIWDTSAIIQGIVDFEEKKFNNYPLGIKQGIAGELLRNVVY